MENLQIFIPEEAEVHTIPLKYLPNVLLRRIGLSKPASGHLSTYISPVAIQKGGTTISQVNKEKLHMTSMRHLRAHKTLNMAFVTTNLTASKVLAATRTSNNTDASSLVPPRRSRPDFNQDALIVYHGHIYLSVKKRRKSMASQRRIPPLPNTDAPIEINSASDSDLDPNTDRPPSPPIEINSASDSDSQEVMESLKNCKTTKNLSQCRDNGLATDSQSSSDMEQVDTVVSHCDGAKPGRVRQSHSKKFPFDTSSSEAEMEDPCQQKTENESLEDNGLATESQSSSDMEQVNAVVSHCNGANPGNVQQRKPKKSMFPVYTSSSEAEMEDPWQQKTENKSLENYKTTKNGLGTYFQSNSDMEQVDTVVSHCDGSNHGKVYTSSSEAEMKDPCQQKTVNMSDNNAFEGEGNAKMEDPCQQKTENVSENNAFYSEDNNALDSEDTAMDSENTVLDDPCPLLVHPYAEVDGAEANGSVTEISAERSTEVPLGHMFTATARRHQKFDYNELAREEELARMRAKLKEKEAALSIFRQK